MKAATLSRLMRLSWEIQQDRKCSRSRSLLQAWAILQNEDTTIFYLVRRFSHSHYPNKVKLADLTLFGVA